MSGCVCLFVFAVPHKCAIILSSLVSWDSAHQICTHRHTLALAITTFMDVLCVGECEREWRVCVLRIFVKSTRIKIIVSKEGFTAKYSCYGDSFCGKSCNDFYSFSYMHFPCSIVLFDALSSSSLTPSSPSTITSSNATTDENASR